MTQLAGRSLSAETLQKEWQFLCLCVSPTTKSTDIAEGPFSEFDWDLLMELADEHGVIGVLAKRLQEINFERVPPASREKLKSRVRAQQLFTLSMTAGLFRIFEEFKRAGIDSVLVKGPVVSLLAYNDPAVRSYVDLDLLVRDKQILAATQTMMELGYEPDIPPSIIEAGKVPGEYVFKRRGMSQTVELHTERTSRYYPKLMPIEDYLARRRSVRLDGQEIPALCIEDEFVYDCIHGAKDLWGKLMWVGDIAAMVFRHPEIDWEQTRKYAEDIGAGRMLNVGLQLAETLLKVPFPLEMKDQVTNDGMARRLCTQVERWLPNASSDSPLWKERALFRMRMRGGRIAGAAYLLRLSLSPTEEDWKEGAEETRPGFCDAVQRPFRLLKKYRSKNG
jgi:hypothetical protein